MKEALGSRLAADVAKVASGSAAGQLMVLAGAPVLTRLYPPSAFGEFAVFLSLVSIFVIIASARYELAITLPEDDGEAADVLVLALAIAGGVTMASGAVAYGAREALPAIAGVPALFAAAWLLPAAVAGQAAVVAMTYWCSRAKRFARIGVSQVVGAATTLTWQIGAGLTGRAGAEMLIIGSALGQAAAALVLVTIVAVQDRRLLAGVTPGSMKAAALRYRRFPLFSSASALMNTVSWQTPVFMLTTLYAPAIAGFYALGHRLLRLPMSFVGRSLSQVFYQRASVGVRDGTLAPLVERMLRGLTALSLLPSLLLALTGRDLFIVVFGAPWAEAGVFVQILSLWTFVWFISSPLSTIFSALERQTFDLGLNAVILLSRIAALTLGAWLGGPRVALALFAVSGVIVYGYLVFAIASAASLPARRVWGIVGGELARSVAWAAPVAAAVAAGLPPPAVLGLAAAVGGIHAARTAASTYRMTFRHG